jgi:hypothetical protein
VFRVVDVSLSLLLFLFLTSSSPSGAKSLFQFFFSFSFLFFPIGRPFDQSMHVQFRVSEYHHFGRIVDARGDLPRLSALLAPRRPLPLLQSTLIGHYIALARHPRIAPVRNSKLFLFTSFYCGTTGTVVVAIERHY